MVSLHSNSSCDQDFCGISDDLEFHKDCLIEEKCWVSERLRITPVKRWKLARDELEGKHVVLRCPGDMKKQRWIALKLSSPVVLRTTRAPVTDVNSWDGGSSTRTGIGGGGDGPSIGLLNIQRLYVSFLQIFRSFSIWKYENTIILKVDYSFHKDLGFIKICTLVFYPVFSC